MLIGARVLMPQTLVATVRVVPLYENQSLLWQQHPTPQYVLLSEQQARIKRRFTGPYGDPMRSSTFVACRGSGGLRSFGVGTSVCCFLRSPSPWIHALTRSLKLCYSSVSWGSAASPLSQDAFASKACSEGFCPWRACFVYFARFSAFSACLSRRRRRCHTLAPRAARSTIPTISKVRLACVG